MYFWANICWVWFTGWSSLQEMEMSSLFHQSWGILDRIKDFLDLSKEENIDKKLSNKSFAYCFHPLAIHSESTSPPPAPRHCLTQNSRPKKQSSVGFFFGSKISMFRDFFSYFHWKSAEKMPIGLVTNPCVLIFSNKLLTTSVWLPFILPLRWESSKNFLSATLAT